MAVKTIDAGSVVTIAPARNGKPVSFSSASLAEARGYDPSEATVVDGRLTYAATDKARGLDVAGFVNGKSGSTRLERSAVLTLAKHYATPRDANDAPTGKPDSDVVKRIMARFPTSGEPPVPSREDRDSVTALRDDFLAYIGARAWTFTTVSRKREALV